MKLSCYIYNDQKKTQNKKGRNILRQYVSQLENIKQRLQPVEKVINIEKECSQEDSVAY